MIQKLREMEGIKRTVCDFLAGFNVGFGVL